MHQEIQSGYGGLGDVADVAAGSALSAGATAVSSIGSSTTLLGAFGGPIGLAAMGIITAINLFRSRKKPGQKIATTKIVDEAEGILKQNLAWWQGSNKTAAEQQQALNNFLSVWEQVKVQCGDPVMGSPGKACIQERDRGGQWDWWGYYYDPIAQDQVREQSFGEQTAGVLGFELPGLPTFDKGTMLLLAAGLLGVLAFTVGGKK